MMRGALVILLGLMQISTTQAQTVSTDDWEARADHRRAVEAIIWGIPAVNFELMYQSAVEAEADWNQIVYWSRPLTWKNQTLTPNPDTIYLMAFYNTKDAGPVVLEIPPAGAGTITGSIDDAWQTAIEDVGPAGADKGDGGKYLVLPPDYDEQIPSGYIAIKSPTYTGFALLRSNLKSHAEEDVAKAVTYGKTIRFYPLSEADKSPSTEFIDAVDILFDSTIPYDHRFFATLDNVVQREPWIERDRAMIDKLRSIGIEKGQPFQLGDDAKALLNEAAEEARHWLDAKYEASFLPYFEGEGWALPVAPDVIEGMSTNFAKKESYPVDGRAILYSIGYFSAKHLGAGQFYLVTIRDEDGESLDGGETYKLTVPANAPVELYWSVTAYDRETHALIKNMDRASRASNAADVKQNHDGSVDIYFGPEAPVGKEANWVPTDPQRDFELMFRAYGPTKEFFDKTWVLPDPEQIGPR